MNWNLLQISDTLDVEFGAALAERVSVLAWKPERTFLPPFRRTPAPAIQDIPDPPLRVRSFKLLRGYTRFPWSALADTGATVSAQLLAQTSEPRSSPLICTIPYFAPVAERWPGPVIYWLTDRIESYDGANSATVRRLDARMCRASTLVCPNSRRLAKYLTQYGQCSESKVRIVPNATRAVNLLAVPPRQAGDLPQDVADLPRPVAGVIGNLAGNMDWFFLESLVRLTPKMSWVFVGPTTMPIEDRAHSAARERVMRKGNVRFVGPKPYGFLAAYARAFDVAVLPYLRREPTYSGSSTRFYEHLAACRPMIATRGFEELLQKEPLLRLVNNADEAAKALADLHDMGFDDGLAGLRWEASKDGTWQARAAFMQGELYASMRLSGT